jgi:hypothetical protein
MLKIKKDKLYFTGKKQSLPFPDDVKIFDGDVEVSIKKEYLKYLDDEVYDVYAKENSVIFQSADSNIKLAVAVSGAEENIQIDDDDDDVFLDDDIDEIIEFEDDEDDS